MKACSFFGHRNTPQTEDLKEKVREIVERLIVEEGVDTFLFGSRSKFDELCHMVVTELKEKYSHIRRIAYLCKHESGCLVGAGIELKQKIKSLTGRDVYIAEYEEIKKSDRVNLAGCASYVERNQEIVDASQYCIFFFDPHYSVTACKGLNQTCLCKSGVRFIYDYAKKNRRCSSEIINLCFETE